MENIQFVPDLSKFVRHLFIYEMEGSLRKFPALRPRTYADEVQKLIERATGEGEPFSMREAVTAISERSGISVDSAFMDLVKAGVVAKFSSTNRGRTGFGV